MIRRLYIASLAAAALVAAQTSVTEIWHIGDHPASLEASIIAVNTDAKEATRSVVTYKLDCPATASPENDACRARGIYPAEVYHTQGSIFGGTVTGKGDGSTTTWSCNLQGCAGCTATPLGGTCVQTLVSGASTTVNTTTLNGCFVAAHYVPAVITAGVGKLDTSLERVTYAAQDILSFIDDDLATLGCPPRTTMVAAGVTGPSGGATPSQPSMTGSAAPTASKPSGSPRGLGASVVFAFVGGMFASLITFAV
jgi:hypothetical protein